MAATSYSSTDATLTTIAYTWDINNPELLKSSSPLYSSSFETEGDVCWQAVLEPASGGRACCGLKFLGCAVLGPYFSTRIELQCFVKEASGTQLPLFDPVLLTFDSKREECRTQCVVRNDWKLKQSSLTLIYRVTTRERVRFIIAPSRLWLELRPRLLTGVGIKAGPSGVVLKAHKEILKSRSSVFAAMLTTDMLEKQQNVITITDMNEGTLRQVLKYIYTDKAQLSGTTLTALLAAADTYDLHRLKAACERALFTIASRALKAIDTSIDILFIVDKYHAPQLKAHLVTFIGINANRATMNSYRWQTLANEYPQLRAYQAMAEARARDNLLRRL